MRRPQEFIRDIWNADLKIINSGNYVGNTHRDNAYTYAIKGLNDKYSNSFYDEKKKIIINMWWPSIKKNRRTCNIDIIKNSVMISKKAYELVYNTPQSIQSYDEYKSRNINKDFGDYMRDVLQLRFEHLTPMQHSFNLLVNLKPTEIDDTHIKECFNYAGLALLTQVESKILDSGSKVTSEVIDELRKMQEKMGKNIIKDSSLKLAEDLSKKSGRAASLLSNGDGLIRIVYLYEEGIRFVSPTNQVLSLEETITELVENTFTINQYN